MEYSARINSLITVSRSHCSVVANVLDGEIVVSEFELQSRCYVHFRTITLRKSRNSFFSAMAFYKNDFWH